MKKIILLTLLIISFTVCFSQALNITYGTSFNTSIVGNDPTQDNLLQFPNKSGVIATLGDINGISTIEDSIFREKSRKTEVIAQDFFNNSLDFNSYITEGLYSVFGNSIYSNSPSYFAFVDGILEVTSTKTGDGTAFTSSNITQTYTHLGIAGTQGTYNGKKFYRNRRNGGWSNWIFTPKEIAFAIRNTSGTWGVIDDVNHIPIGVSSVTQSDVIGSPNFTFNVPFFKVGGVSISVDETYAKQGLFVGNSVGLGPVFCYVYKHGAHLNVVYDGSNFISKIPNSVKTIKSQDFTYSFNATNGNLTVTHTNLIFDIDDIVVVSPTDPSCYPILISQGADNLVIRFVDMCGHSYTQLNQNMNFNISRMGVFQVPNENLALTNSNFWVVGLNH